MKFFLVDRILEIEPGRRLVAVKNLSLAEEYLADHFPSFPVLPGVLMLEGLVQAAGWLVQSASDFAYGRTVLREAKAVKYGKFVAPGATLRLEVEALRIEEGESVFRGTGTVDGEQAVSARLTLEHHRLGTRAGSGGADPPMVRQALQGQFAILTAGLEESAHARRGDQA